MSVATDTPCLGSARLRPAGAKSAGHTLLELVVVLAIIGLAVALGASGLGRVLDAAGSRADAQVWQAAAAAAQVRSLWGRQAVEVVAVAEGIGLGGSGDASHAQVGATNASWLSSNVNRWRMPDGVRVRFVPPFAAPDSAGSLVFGGEGVGSRVVVRAESGLTRRDRP